MTRTLTMMLAASCLMACGPDAELDRTLATVELVRGDATIDDDAVARVGRVAPSQSVVVAERGLARLSLDSGSQLLMDASSSVSLVDESTIELTAGRVYAEAGEGEELYLTAGERVLRASDAALSASLDGDLAVYVVRGEVSWTLGDERGIAHAGERLTLGREVITEPVTLWHDWTGGLAQPGPADARGPAGVGVLEARVPDEIGRARWPLVIRRLDVQVRIVGDLAVTEVEQVFFNPASEMVEGLYRIRVPEDAVLQRFAVDRDGRLVDGYVREKAQARQAYEAQVYRGSQLDPALLEWVAPGRYSARIYPIRPGETRRIVVRYAEWLEPLGEDGTRLYRYPMGAGRNAPRVQELSLAVDIEEAGVEHMRAGMGAAVEEGRVRLRRSDFAPRSDFWLELSGPVQDQRAWRAPHEPPPRAPDSREVFGEADERDYWYLPLRLPERLFADARAEGVDLVIVVDVSAATERSHLELGRSVAEALTAHLGENDRVAIVTSDLTIRPIGEGGAQLGDLAEERIEDLLDGLARASAGGATDLGAAIAAAAGLLDPARSGAVIYIGDGAPTVGELEADGLLERIARLPTPLRLYAVGIGGDANLDLLEALTRGGGLALRVEERSGAADAALRILGHATRPVAQRVTIDVGTGIENVYPRRPVDTVQGDVLPVVGRIREEPPTSVIVRGIIAGEEFEERIPLQTLNTEESTDLRLRWAGERLRQLLLEGAQREEVAELGTRYGLITPFTSYYVPSASELNQMGQYGLRWIDRPDLFGELDRERAAEGSGLWAIALWPLAIAGCSSQDDAPAGAATEAVSVRSDDSESEVTAVEVAEEAPMDMPMAAPEQPGSPAPPPAPPRQGMRGDGSGGGGGGSFGDDLAGGAVTGNDEEIMARAEIATVAGNEVRGPLGGLNRGAPGTARGALGGAFDGLARGGDYGGAATGAAAEPSSTVAAAPEPAVVDSSNARRRRARGSSARPAPVSLDPALHLLLEESLGGERNGRDLRLEGERAPSGDRLAGFYDADDDEIGSPRGQAHPRGRAPAREAELPRVITSITMIGPAHHHARRRCSDAARLSLADRGALWTERLGARSGPSGWVRVFRRAIRDCEAPTWRDRRALLSRILARAGNVQRMIDVYRIFTSGSARGYLRSAILRRVRSPQDLRLVRGAFSLGREPDHSLVEQVLERANGQVAKLRALRRLTMQYPGSFDLKLRFLEALEVGGHRAEARRLADRLRADPRSDAGVRTAVGEMFLRVGHEEEARRVFSEIVEFAPLDELARRRLGDLYRAHGWFEDAYRQYQTLASIRPDDPTALLLLAQAAAGTGRIDEALRLEQRLMETAQPGAQRGIARIAQLWTSVRLAKLRLVARETGDEERLGALERRMRRSGVLSEAGDFRVTLIWSHPDAQIGLYTSHPGAALTRPIEIAPEHGIEAFDVLEQEDGTYRFEVRRADPRSPTTIEAELVVVWHEGREDEVIYVVPLTFEDGRDVFAWTLEGSALEPQ